jgi:leucyl aminopeptidase
MTMNNLLNAENSGIPLIIIEQASYTPWLAKQTQQQQNWLANTQYQSKGLALIPDTEGELKQALFIVADASDYFACGDLIKQLPSGQYLLEAEEKHVEAISFGWLVGAYQFDRYVTKKSDKKFATLAINNADIVDNAIKAAQATALTRDLVNTPAADMMPIDIAQATQELAAKFNGKVKQIIGDELLVHNYPTIHAVGRASIHTPRLIDLTWGDDKNPRVTLVGKGVCFDSGGLDIKPAAGMRNMKIDMG